MLLNIGIKITTYLVCVYLCGINFKIIVMKKILFLLAMLPMIISCQKDGNPIDKSIISPLSIEDIHRVIKDEPLFNKMYKNCIENVELTKLDSAKYMDITYSRLLDFFKVQDTINIIDGRKECKKRIATYDEKADSIVDRWAEYLKNNNINESDSLKTIFGDYKGIIEQKELRKTNDRAKLSYAFKRFDLIRSLLDEDYMLSAEMTFAAKTTRTLKSVDSLCYEYFKKTKYGKDFNDKLFFERNKAEH